MLLNVIQPRKSLNKAYLKQKPSRHDIDIFKNNLKQLIDSSKAIESEEFHKNLVADFLKKTYYSSQYFINTKGRTDLVIYNGKDSRSSAGVIIETKNPTNKAEMLSLDNINVKAFHELILYYLRERITGNNLDIKYIIATNIYQWFIFDAHVFEKLFAQNKNLVSLFIDFETGRSSGMKTDFFYNEIAKPYVDRIQHEIPFVYFNLQDYEKPLRNKAKADDNKLIALYKIFSPVHLLKLPFANDSNSLDKQFYTELLHIIGLTETKQGGKKLIQRKQTQSRNAGSLIENTILQLESLDKISRLENVKQYGKNQEEILFAIALELCITWINRILFLKLLEAQLLKYNKGNAEYAFLNSSKIHNYDDLNTLFFQVLAKQHQDRSIDIQREYPNVPFLNSSLFELTELEHTTIIISNLRNEKSIPIPPTTVLKDNTGKQLSGEILTIEYLLKFLNSYDFSSEGSEDIQEDNKTLINASVLGLIFEKINGYKDGSFFTPGFITMFMCRETIRKAVVQKFNDAKGWKCQNLTEIYNMNLDIKEANDIVNSVKICDPAVGSGHFLVSALNEIISIKSDLQILADKDGKRLKHYQIEIVNDELVLTDEDGELFEYIPSLRESQRVQETLFHEKQTIIENCLFGVDINPNSVKICRLRLWIELLKNAYYKNSIELETLPNIDINIKCGNSLISKYSLNVDLSQVLKKNKWTIDSYRIAVQTYRNAKTKEEKREMERLILSIKQDFTSHIRYNDPLKKRYDKISQELYNRFTGNFIFEPSEEYKTKKDKKLETQRQKEQLNLEREIAEIYNKMEDIKNNTVFQNSFEWRFEFPEVLDNDGRFIGFDVVIGNPPYMRIQEIQATQPLQKNFYEQNYLNANASYDLANVFFELAINISTQNCTNAFIFPHKFFNAASSGVFRNYLTKGKYIDKVAHFGANMIFNDADTYTCVAFFSKNSSNGFFFQRFPFKSDFRKAMLDSTKYIFLTYDTIQEASKLYGNNQWILFEDNIGFDIFQKIYKQKATISTKFERISQGIATGKDEIYLFEGKEKEMYVEGSFMNDTEKRRIEIGILKPFLKGKDVHRYSTPSKDLYILFPYKTNTDGKIKILTQAEIKQVYPNAYEWLKETEMLHRKKDNGSTNDAYWYRYARNQGIDFAEQPKLSSMEICANHPNVIFDTDKYYHPTTVYSWIKSIKTKESYEYFLAIANSKLLWWFLKNTGDTLQGDARRFKTNYLNPFPLPKTIDKHTENTIVQKVKDVQSIKQVDSSANTTAIEAEIDRLVYQLYDLTDCEIDFIENNI